MFAEKIRRSLPPLLMGALLIVAHPVRAEVILQGSSMPLPGPAIMVSGNVPSAQVKGTNLFHSFSVFNILRQGTSLPGGPVVPAQESVTFTSPTVGGTPIPITNVISR